MSGELDDDMGDFDLNASANSDDNVDSSLIKKILFEMKSEFNRGICTTSVLIPSHIKSETNDALTNNTSETKESMKVKVNGHFTDSDAKNIEADLLNDSVSSYKDEPPIADNTEDSVSATQAEAPEDDEHQLLEEESNLAANCGSPCSEKVIDEDEPPKKRLKLKKDKQKIKSAPVSPLREESYSVPEKKSRRLPRLSERVDAEVTLKRSSRRMSKDSKESVLQNAIAIKEKSFSSLVSTEEKHRRSGRICVEKNVKTKTSNKTSPKNDEPSFRGFNDSFKSTPVKGKSPNNTNASDENEVEDGIYSSTPKKAVKFCSLPTENGFEDESNTVSSSQQSEMDCDKESSSGFSSGSGKARKKCFSFSQECRQPLAKRIRTENSSMVPEATDVPQCEPTLPPVDSSKWSCECQKNENLFSSKGSLRANKFCKALDSFDEKVVGCMNQVDEDTPLLRPSSAIPFFPYCDVHISRLIRHNCCPTCGIFCSKGYFVQCKELHFFHKDCEMKKDDASVCPHCSSGELTDIKLSYGVHQYPVFLPSQKDHDKFSARMRITKNTYADMIAKDEAELNELVPRRELVFHKKKTMSESLPPAEKEKLENLLHAFASRNDLFQRFSGRAFYAACKYGDVEKVYSMLGGTNGLSKENGSSQALHAAAGNGHLVIVHLLVQFGLPLEVLDKNQHTPLMLATLNNHNAVVKYLVKAGADVAFKGIDGMTALHLAARIGNLEACHYLLSAANKSLSVDALDDGNWTPLVWAAENNHAKVVRYLLERKADPQIRDSEMNIALHWSAFSGSMEITEDLLNYGSNMNVANVHGDTPLHIAARQGAENCVLLLLARGARTDVKNKNGQFPKDCTHADFPYCRIAIELNMKVKSISSKSFFVPRILSNDISKGQEPNPIQCVNNIDNDPLPKDFTYISDNCVTSNLPVDRRITSLHGCKCEDDCTTSSCLCTKTSLRCWYDNRGRLLPEFNFYDPPMIFECNQTCDCNAITCKNRVVQKGLKVRLEVCKTKKKNWGVITLKEIPKGSYVCEYIGEIISDFEADHREDDSYLFDLDSRDGEAYCIDARRYGNVTRFVNHSCKPNLVPVRIFVGHHDLHFPRIAFFAARDIAPNEELGFDYGEKFWVIKYKNFCCSCEEPTCRYSDTTIHETLEKYKEKLKLEESL